MTFNPYDPDPGTAFKREDFPSDPSDPRRAWTIKVVIWTVHGEVLRRDFIATNMVTGEEKPPRASYDEALADIPPGEWHNYIQ